MMWHREMKTIAATLLIVLLAGVNVTPVLAQPKGPSKAEVEKLREEVVRLRADLNAAIREINALKAALGGAKVVPEQGPLFRGRPASYWQDQLTDAEATTRLDAVVALAALVQKDKKLIPPLVETAKNDPDLKVRTETIRALGPAGPDALPALIEIVKARKPGYQNAIGAIGTMEARAKPAVAELIKVLKEEKDTEVLEYALPALRRIGPDAREAIPAVVSVLGDCIKEADSKAPKGDNKVPKKGFRFKAIDRRFGVTPGYLNVTAWSVLLKLDPELENAIPAPPIVREGGIRDTKEQRDEWRRTHEALVKRYAKSP